MVGIAQLVELRTENARVTSGSWHVNNVSLHTRSLVSTGSLSLVRDGNGNSKLLIRKICYNKTKNSLRKQNKRTKENKQRTKRVHSGVCGFLSHKNLSVSVLFLPFSLNSSLRPLFCVFVFVNEFLPNRMLQQLIPVSSTFPSPCPYFSIPNHWKGDSCKRVLSLGVMECSIWHK